MIKLSVIIPSYKDPYLFKTVEDLLKNSELEKNELEIIICLDGYWIDKIFEDSRVKIVHLGRNRGMRDAINAGVDIAKGEYIMRTDEHSCFDKGYDVKLLANIKDNWIVTPRRYFLDPVKWKIMDLPYVDYEKLVIRGNKFCGVSWPQRDKKNKHKMIDQTMAMQGSCWIMKKSWWEKVIVKLQTEGYGPLYQDSHEMIFKTWKAGGKLVLNKNTWHAHKHRSFPRTHNNGTKENPSNNEQCFAYSLKIWRDYYLNEIKPKWKI